MKRRVLYILYWPQKPNAFTLLPMYYGREPRWLQFVECRLSWLAIPNLAGVLVGIQAFGLLLLMVNPAWMYQLPLIPDRLLNGEFWRLVSFLAIPLASGIFGFIFAVGFLYFVVNSLESAWGAFKTTFYLLISVVLMILFSLVTGYPVTSISGLAATLFLAAAALFPEQQIQIYFFIPVKMKYLGWLALAFVGLQMLRASWLERAFLLVVYSNYLVFFGPTLIDRIKEWKRRRDFRAKWRGR